MFAGIYFSIIKTEDFRKNIDIYELIGLKLNKIIDAI